ncbi:Tyrosine-protein phosphatase SIW14 [Tolypocladium ophioglossoides CBS 100239]|uniref:Tyrosine-protein phosphatase SIW14 n=1 Tax=Tolypocladium ophioglossoides (strain CBS 100239) TaxID=1163406 RepID=A0A0L0NIW2_TOLOC|nr:Tyrosine-protein phosphatase SIW14 [Tolypocladium ophioglossoides CBS 100239]
MASKRNSRVYVDDGQRREEGHQKPMATPYGPRDDSRGSIKDDLLQLAQEMEEGQWNGTLPREVVPNATRSQSIIGGPRETTVLGTSSNRIGDKTGKQLTPSPRLPSAPNGAADHPSTATIAAKVSIAARSVEYPAAPTSGRPANFGVVVPGVYRSSYPKPDDYGFLQSLKLKTVLTLVKREELDHEFESFTTDNGIRQVIFNMKGTKKEAIPVATMASILELVLDRQNYPLLLHCNHGKHRTGCVVAVVRKLSGWALHNVLDEYKTYAMPKIRECDVDSISAFQSSSLQSLTYEPARFSPVQIRTFFRTLLFSTFVMVLWLVSGSQMSAAPDEFAA